MQPIGFPAQESCSILDINVIQGTGKCNIKYESEYVPSQVAINISSIDSYTIKSHMISDFNGETELDISNIKNGYYIVTVSDGKTVLGSKQILIH